MRSKPQRTADGNTPSCVLVPLVNYTAPDGAIGTLYPDYSDTIEATEPHVRDAVAQARTLGSDVEVRFVALSGQTVTCWRVG